MARAETRFRLSAKWTSPFKSVGGGGAVYLLPSAKGPRTGGSNVDSPMFWEMGRVLLPRVGGGRGLDRLGGGGGGVICGGGGGGGGGGSLVDY